MQEVLSYNIYIYFSAGEEFKDHSKCLKGNNDILNLTKPELIFEIHKVHILHVVEILCLPVTYRLVNGH